MRCLGFANHTPDEVLRFLRSDDVCKSSIHICREDEIITTQNYKHIFFLSVGAFVRNITGKLASCGATFYVFDDPLSLMRYDIQKADFVPEHETFHIDGFSLVTLTKIPAVADVESVKRTHFNIVDKATEVAKAQITFLNQFMTFIYSMPSETHQKPIKEAVCKWMASTESLQQFQNKFAKLRKTVHLTEKQVKRMMDILSSDTTVKYRHALQQTGDEDDVAKRLKLSAYELRYIRAINRGTA